MSMSTLVHLVFRFRQASSKEAVDWLQASWISAVLLGRARQQRENKSIRILHIGSWIGMISNCDILVCDWPITKGFCQLHQLRG